MTSERIINKIGKLFDLYEKHSCLNEYGDETNQLAGEYYSEALTLFNSLPIDDRHKTISHC